MRRKDAMSRTKASAETKHEPCSSFYLSIDPQVTRKTAFHRVVPDCQNLTKVGSRRTNGTCGRPTRGQLGAPKLDQSLWHRTHGSLKGPVVLSAL